MGAVVLLSVVLRMLKDERVRQDPKRTIFAQDDFADVLG